MNELRKIEKAVKKYEKTLNDNEKIIKENLKVCTNDLELIMAVLEAYIDSTLEIFQKWCDISVDVFSRTEDNIFLKLKRGIEMKIVNHYLNKLSYEISMAYTYQRRLEQIQMRVAQFQYWL